LTAFFHKKLWNQPIAAWHPLGYIYDLTIEELSSLCTGQSIQLCYQQLHAIFEAILETLLEARQPHVLDGIELTLGGITRKVVNLKVPIAFISGDIQGGNKIVHVVHHVTPTKSNDYSISAISMGWMPTIPPFVVCKWMIMSRIQALVENQEYDKLDSIIQYHVHNAWFLLDSSGCHSHRGLFSAVCLVEALHAMENG
jgi:hypothetical protein